MGKAESRKDKFPTNFLFIYLFICLNKLLSILLSSFPKGRHKNKNLLQENERARKGQPSLPSPPPSPPGRTATTVWNFPGSCQLLPTRDRLPSASPSPWCYGRTTSFLCSWLSGCPRCLTFLYGCFLWWLLLLLLLFCRNYIDC